MKNFSTPSLFLLLLLQLVSGERGENCVAIEELGTPSLENFDYSISIAVDDGDEYTLTIDFKHDEDLPIPSDPQLQCDPSINPPAIADDGLPYFAFRWYYQAVPENVKMITGIDHVSIDWNACGHPPKDIFTSMNYGVRIYRKTPEYRTCMTCQKIPGAAVCDPTPGAQTTDNGKAFFNVARASGSEKPNNMPQGFDVPLSDMVPLMGARSWDSNQEPVSSLDWNYPIWIMGSYNGTVSNFEPTIPFTFMSGTEDRLFEEQLDYEGQTLEDLPSRYRVEWSGETSVVTITLKGTSLLYAPPDETSAGSYMHMFAPTTLCVVLYILYIIS